VTRQFLFLFTGVLLSACVSKTENRQGFYNVDSLVSKQIQLLPALKATVTKTTQLNDQHEESKLQEPDSIVWNNELQIFRELEAMNKPTSKEVYTVTDNFPDDKSNLKVMLVERKPNLQTPPPVRYFKLYYQEHTHNVRRIEAQLDESNALYKSTRLFTMQFQTVRNNLMLTTYSIQGGQKMFLGDSVAYSIHGVVRLPN